MFHKVIKKIESKFLSAFSKRTHPLTNRSKKFSSINELLKQIKNEALLSGQPEKLKICITLKKDEFIVSSNANVNKLHAMMLVYCMSYIYENADKLNLLLESPKYGKPKIKNKKVIDFLLLLSDVFARRYQLEEMYKQAIQQNKNEGPNKEV